MKGFYAIALLLAIGLAPALSACAEAGAVASPASTVALTIGDARFTATLVQNETAEAFRAMLPATLPMSELNGNEKYVYLDASLPSAPERIGHIEAGDLMLYGDDCLVLFYKSFDTSYSYTRIGHMDNVEGLGDAVGGGAITVAFAAQAGTPVTVTIGGMSLPAVLRDNTPARDLLSRLPYSVTLNRGEVDFCGDAGAPFAYEEAEYQQGFEYGDLIYMPDGNYFVLFTDGIETYGQKDWLVLGHMDCDMDALRGLSGSVAVTVSAPQ